MSPTKATRAVAIRRPMPGMVMSWATAGVWVASAASWLLDHLDAALEVSDLGADLREGGTERVGDLALGVFELGPGGGDGVLRRRVG